MTDWLRDNIGDPFDQATRDALVRLIDPIVLDIDGDGVELLSRADADVYFDMDGDGRKELTGWVGADDALLVIDSNADGKVESIDELVGDLGRSGFAELATHDSNGDRVIDANDAVWSTLKVWQDANTNGVVDDGEMVSAAAAGIKAIDLRFTTVNFTAQGNQIHEQATFEKTDGTTGLIVDAWFDVDNVIAARDPTLTGDSTVDSLPDIPGSGDLASLRTVMALDGMLTSLVSGLVGRSLTQMDGVRDSVVQILYRWADAEDVDPASRGGLFDARALAVLETILGTEYFGNNSTNPNALALPNLNVAWNALVNGATARLLLAGPIGDLLTETLYSTAIDRLVTLSTPAELMAQLAAGAPRGDALDTAEFWIAALPVARAIFEERGIATGALDYRETVAAALAPFGLEAFGNLLDDEIVQLTGEPQVIQANGVYRGTAGNDVYVVDTAVQAVYALAGDDRISVTSGSISARTLLSGGDGRDVLTGNAGSDWLDGGAGVDEMAGGTGDDTYILDDPRDAITELANAGTDTIHASFSYVLGSGFENLVLTGLAESGTGNAAANAITGNAQDNALSGLGGNDVLDGGAGADTMRGGEGNDRYIVDAAGDRVIEAGAGIDTVESSVSYTLREKLENLVLGGSADRSATGNALANLIVGNDGANQIDGRGGADTMRGGLGDDVYVVDNAGDRVFEETSAGNDRVIASTSFTLGGNIEQLILTGLADIDGMGNALANILTGNDGDNRLNGAGGDDRMAGKRGDDTYVIDTLGDVIVETATGGTDRVETKLVSYTLGQNVENLRLYVGTTDTVARSGTGNALANAIDGTGGLNTLDGAAGDDLLQGFAGEDVLIGGEGNDVLDGGAGIDRMTGGSGDDLYVVNLIDDIVVESTGGGTDTIQSAISYILGANLENLELTGAGRIDGQGNERSNLLIGNANANGLDGGRGADTMAGGLGDDIYTLDHAGDRVIETPGAGVDTVRSSISYALGASVEHLILLGSAALNATGNELANRIDGNAGDNVIIGGLGRDTMSGGAGADRFVFTSRNETSKANATADAITDFSAAAGDRIDVGSIDAILGTPSDDAFTFVGSAAFTAAGQVRAVAQGGVQYLLFNMDDVLTSAEMVIALQNAAFTIDASDFDL